METSPDSVDDLLVAALPRQLAARMDVCQVRRLSALAAAPQEEALREALFQLAYEQCKLHPDLLCELRSTLDLLAQRPMPPAVRCARREVLRKLSAR